MTVCSIDSANRSYFVEHKKGKKLSDFFNRNKI